MIPTQITWELSVQLQLWGQMLARTRMMQCPPFLYTILYDQLSPLDTVAGSFGQKRSLGLGCLPGATLVLKGLQAESGRLLCPTLSGTHSANKPGR